MKIYCERLATYVVKFFRNHFSKMTIPIHTHIAQLLEGRFFPQGREDSLPVFAEPPFPVSVPENVSVHPKMMVGISRK